MTKNYMFNPVDQHVNFPEMEKKLLEYWEKNGIYQKYLHKNDKSKKRFSFFDGPITANNPMGVHHGWSRTYKDVWQRYYNLKGYRQRFQNGFDCQGLWVEVEVEKELGIRNKKDIENLVPGDKKASIDKFVNLCKERVIKYSSMQTLQSKRLGYFMDWDNSYFTMSDENNYMIWHFLKVCFENGWIYKGTESVPWCPRCETAISQHEMLTEDYKELTHDSIIMKFPIIDRKKEYLLVWTTTPWTIIANIAIAVDIDADYSLVSVEDSSYWLASSLVAQIFKNHQYKVKKQVKGQQMLDMKYRSAFDGIEAVEKARSENIEKFHTVIPTDPMIMPISMEEGTGMVHTAVSAGEEDFKLGKKLGLPMIPVIGDDAAYLPGLGNFSGKNAKKHPEIILDYLRQKEEKEKSWVFRIFPYSHRYPACWRCKTELVWKVADEWYIAMDVRPLQNQKSKIKNQNETSKINNQTLRERMIGVAKKIKWLPEFGLERELDWLKNMHDWLISKKNRYWGLALPIFECKTCGNFEVIGGFEELKEKAVEGWEKMKNHTPHKPWIDEVKIKCNKCGHKISRINDVGNPWLDAGIISFSTLVDPKNKKVSYLTDKKYWTEWFPADFITESFPGQFKNWFYSLIAMSAVLVNTNPFKTVLGFGTVLGEDGRPMHKSWGNAIEFNEGADKIGVDVMRWMYVTQNPSNNLLFGYKKADETRRQFHLLLWNIYNFFVTYANTDSWKREMKNSNWKDYSILDRWILSRFINTVKNVEISLDKFDSMTASLSISGFVTDFSTWYIRRSRERVGVSAEDATDKNNFYSVCYYLLVNLAKIIAPFNPFISDEIFRNLTNDKSVHLSDWPFLDKEMINDKLESQMTFLRKIVEDAHAIRKESGIKVRQPLNKLTYYGRQSIDQDLYYLLIEELNVKKIEFSKKNTDEYSVILDTFIDKKLLEEGKARDIIRQVQILRKDLGCNLSERINLVLPEWPGEMEDYIKKKTLSDKIEKGNEIKVTRL